MQAQGYTQAVGQNVDEFWRESNMLASNQEMYQGLAYMYMMKEYSNGKIVLTKDTLTAHGKGIQLFSGVEKWFEQTKEYGKKCGVEAEHYIISSGLKEMIEGTSVAESGAHFKRYMQILFYMTKMALPFGQRRLLTILIKPSFFLELRRGSWI